MTGKMKVAIMNKARDMQWIERAIPQPGPSELQIKLEYVGICGSDLHYYQDGRLGNLIVDNPMVLGHEPGGVVVSVGEGVEGFAPGDKVALEPGVPCNTCNYCKKGLYNLCGQMSFMADPTGRDGVFSEYCIHSADMCFKLPDNMDTMEGALIEPLAVGFHVVQSSGAKIGQSAIVLGCGCIGLVTIMVLKASGINDIYAVDVLEKRLEKAAELGAKPVNGKEQNIVDIASKLPGGGVDLVFETAGSPFTMLQTAKLVKMGGSVTLVGITAEPEITFDIGTLMDKEAQLHTVFRYRNFYPAAIAAVSGGSIPIKSIVSHVFDFKDVIKGVEFNTDNKQEVIKAVVKF